MRPVRATAALVSCVLALGLGAPPSSAVATERPAGDGPSLAQLRALAAGVDRDAVLGPRSDARVAGGPRRVDVVTDPRGDAGRDGGLGRARPYDRLADLTRVRYKTPSTRNGDLRVTTRWVDLVDGSERGVRRQTQVTIVFDRRTDEVWVMEVSNATDRVEVTRIGSTPQEDTPVRPRTVSVERSFGPGGTTDVILSSEWLGERRRIGFLTYGYSGTIKSLDPTDSSKQLVLGPVDR